MDQISQQWVDYFAQGGIYLIPYNLEYHARVRKEQLISASAGAGLGGAVAIGLTHGLQEGHEKMYLGDNPNAAIGMSQAGLHFPTVPLIMWEDVIALNFSNLRSTWAGAANASIIPDPGVGSTGTFIETEYTVLFKNTAIIKPTVVDANNNSRIIIDHTTRSGQQWGQIAPLLDPALGAEQIVEYVYLLNIMCGIRGIPIYHTNPHIGIVGGDRVTQGILAAN